MTDGSKPRALRYTSQFKADLKNAPRHRKCDMESLRTTMQSIVDRKPLDAALKDHKLTGRYPDQRDGATDCRECHTSNDWLLVYRFPDDDTVHFIRTGTHSDLF